MGYFPFVGQRIGETTFLQGTGYGYKNGKHSYHTIVIGIEQPGQKYPKEQIQQLLYTIAESAPE